LEPELVGGKARRLAQLALAGAEGGEDVPLLPARRVPLLRLYGLEDDRVSPEAVEASLDAWVSGRVCRDAPRVRESHAGRMRRREWPGCGDIGPVAAFRASIEVVGSEVAVALADRGAPSPGNR
jgi:hypothetical protein